MHFFRHTVYVVLLGGVLVVIGWLTSSSAIAQTCTPPPTENIQIQAGGATHSYGTTGNVLQGRVGVSFSATIQTLGISSPLDISIIGLPSGIEHRSTPLNPFGGNNFSGTPTQQGTFTIQITLENDCGSETYTLPLTIVAANTTPTPTPTPTPSSGGGSEPPTPMLAHKATLIDLPLIGQLRYLGGGIGSQRILDLAYFGDNLAFSGECGGGKDQQYNQDGFQGTHGGAWFFKDSGAFVAERNACIDGGAQYLSLLFHGHAYSALSANGDQGVVMRIRSHGASCQNCFSENPQGGPGAYKPVYYQVAGSSVSATPAPWSHTEGYTNYRFFGALAAASNILVAENTTNPPVTSLLQLPTFQSLGNAPQMTPITGFDGYVIGQAASQGGNCPGLSVYRATSGSQLQFLHTLQTDSGLCIGAHGVDYTTNPKHIGFMTYRRVFDPVRGREISQATNRLFIFAAGVNGLELVEERQLPRTDINFVYGVTGKDRIGIAGDYLALPLTGSRFEVWQGNTRIGEAELPLTRAYGPEVGSNPGDVQKLLITKNGDVMASTYLAAHLFDLTTLTPGGAPPIEPGTVGPGLGLEPGFFENFARQYLDLLKQFFNAQ